MDLPHVDPFTSVGVPLGLAVPALLLAAYVFGVVSEAEATETLGLVLVNTFMTKFYVWNLLSCHVLDTSILRLLAGLLGVRLLLPAAEARLGPLQTLQFLVVVLVGVSLGTSTLNFFLYVLFREEHRLFGAAYGYAGLLSALLMTMVANSPHKKVWPEAPAALKPLLGSLQLRQLPLVLLLGASALSWLGLEWLVGNGVFFGWLGSFLSWHYLRYVALSREGVRGDFRRPLETIGAFCFGIMILLGFFKQRLAHLRHLATVPQREEGLMDPSQALSSPVIGLNLSQGGRNTGGTATLTPMKVKKDPVTMRRRERAENMLNARLKELELEQESISEWSDEEDPSSSASKVDEANKENLDEAPASREQPAMGEEADPQEQA